MANDIDINALNGLGLTRQTGEGTSDRLGQEDFLDLMVQQLRNQDPFDPMKSEQFLGQLAQFGTVTGIADMQKSLDDLAGSVRGQQTLQAASLIDREVLVPAREAWLPPEGALRGDVDVPEGAVDVEVDVYDLHGTLVGRLPVERDGGTAAFDWDGALADGGRAEPGFYELRATGRVDGEEVALDTLVAGRVESVSTGGAEGSLALTVTGLGVVDFHSVRGIGQ